MPEMNLTTSGVYLQPFLVDFAEHGRFVEPGAGFGTIENPRSILLANFFIAAQAASMAQTIPVSRFCHKDQLRGAKLPDSSRPLLLM